MVEMRSYPRTRLSVPVSLHCVEKNRFYRRKIDNISQGGLFVSGAPCGRAGVRMDVIVDHAGQKQQVPDRYPAQVVRTLISGFALRFNHLDEQKKCSLEELIWPKWDGEELFEGLLIVAPHTDTVDLAGWMRLTSILCNQYRRLCSKNHIK